jgi:hypothetical protein
MVALLRRFRWAPVPIGLLAVLVGSLLFASGSGASRPVNVARSDAVFSTRGQIAKLAASGNLVAALTTHIPGSNDQIVVWWSPGSKVTRFVTGENVASPDSAVGNVSELALGSGRVAWLEILGGNSVDDVIYAAPVGGGAAKQLVDVANSGGASGGIDGDYAGQLLGSGPLLFYNQWHVCDYEDSGGTPTPACPVRGKISAQKLVSIVAGRPVPVAIGPNAFRLVAVGGGRLAFEPADTYYQDAGKVRVTTAAAATAATVPAVTGNPPRAGALSAAHLLVERAHTIDSYNPATGAHVGTIPLGSASLQLAGVNARLALLRGPHQLVLIRLSDGKRVTIPSSAVVVDAKLNETGLFYANNVPSGSSKGRIVFEPTARLLARF